MKAWLAAILVAWAALLGGCAASGPKPDFRVTREAAGPPLAGFGACMNPYLYAYPNWPGEVNERNVGDLEAKVKELRPQFVRVFFLNSWWEEDTDPSIAKGHPGMRQSLLRTLRLAQDAGATVLLQFWYDPKRYADADGVAGRFAAAIAEMRSKYGLTAIRYATIQNEPNDDDKDMTPETYVRVYRAFDRALRERGIRDHVRIIGGDLLEEREDLWFRMLGKELSPVLDGYSTHVYWDYWDIEKMKRRMHESAAMVRALPNGEQRPLYVTEFGAQGFRDNPQIEPGKSVDGKPLADVPTYTFEIAILMMEAINNGYAGTAQWDMYEVWYDRKMGYGVIGSAEKGFPKKPGYDLLSMFTHAVQPGWNARRVDGSVYDVWVSAVGKKDAGAVFVLNRKEPKEVTVGGFRPGETLSTQAWNADGSGALSDVPATTAGPDGVVRVKMARDSVMVLKH